jgi:hypothetical protein
MTTDKKLAVPNGTHPLSVELPTVEALKKACDDVGSTVTAAASFLL